MSGKEDWGAARPAEIPRPTIWPAGLAFGITFLMWASSRPSCSSSPASRWW